MANVAPFSCPRPRPCALGPPTSAAGLRGSRRRRRGSAATRRASRGGATSRAAPRRRRPGPRRSRRKEVARPRPRGCVPRCRARPRPTIDTLLVLSFFLSAANRRTPEGTHRRDGEVEGRPGEVRVDGEASRRRILERRVATVFEGREVRAVDPQGDAAEAQDAALPGPPLVEPRLRHLRVREQGLGGARNTPRRSMRAQRKDRRFGPGRRGELRAVDGHGHVPHLDGRPHGDLLDPGGDGALDLAPEARPIVAVAAVARRRRRRRRAAVVVAAAPAGRASRGGGKEGERRGTHGAATTRTPSRTRTQPSRWTRWTEGALSACARARRVAPRGPARTPRERTRRSTVHFETTQPGLRRAARSVEEERSRRRSGDGATPLTAAASSSTFLSSMVPSRTSTRYGPR